MEQNVEMFNTLLINLDHPTNNRKEKDSSRKDQEYLNALKIRKYCLEIFLEIETLAKLVRELGVGNQTQWEKRLFEAVYVSTLSFLQKFMFRLQSMPDDKSKSEFKIKTVNGNVYVLEDTIEELNRQLKEAVGRRRFEDADVIKGQIQEMEKELELYKNLELK